VSWFPTEPVGSTLFLPASLLKRVLTLRRSLHMHAAWLGLPEGDGITGKGSGIYCGEGDSLRFLASLHGGHPGQTRSVRWSQLRDLVGTPDRDFVLYVEVNRSCSWLLPGGGYWTLPWIRQKLRLDQAGKRRGGRAVEGVYGRRVRRHHFQPKLCLNRDSLVEFFSHMYLPYMEHRYGAEAQPRSLHQLLRAQRSGFLLKVEENGQWVAGAVCQVRRSEVTILTLAVAPPFDDLLRRGALSAVYYFLIGWAREQGMGSVDMLRSRPHVADGVYEHKRRFGAEPHVDAWPHTAIWIYPPQFGAVPALAGGLLVRRGTEFVPLAKLLTQGASPPRRGA
jgi:hypothetical protein